MKYKLLKELPFMKADKIFTTGSWVGGGFGVDRGTTRYEGGGTSHNGTTTFSPEENKILTDIMDDKNWVEKIPENRYEFLDLYDKGIIDREEMLAVIKILES